MIERYLKELDKLAESTRICIRDGQVCAPADTNPTGLDGFHYVDSMDGRIHFYDR